MTKPCRCAFCRGALEPAQQLRFLVETDNLDNPPYLARIRALPHANGRPLPVCKSCQARLEAHPRAPAKRAPKSLAPDLLGMFGALSVGLLLGALFNTRG